MTDAIVPTNPDSPVTPPPMGGPVDDALGDAALAASRIQQALDSLDQLVTAQQTQIEVLKDVAAKHADAIARITAATRLHACPAGHVGASGASNIGECIDGSLCNCEVGHILTAATWTPTPPSA